MGGLTYIVTYGNVMTGKRLTEYMIHDSIWDILDRRRKAVVMIIHVGGARLNCQSMNTIIFIDILTLNIHKC